MRLILTILAGLALVQAAAAQQYPTIVGTWYNEHDGRAACSTDDAWRISPMAIETAILSCEFDTVSRDGWVVTWTGSCAMPDDPMRGNQVVATENSGVLTIQFGSAAQSVEGLRRCEQ